MQLKYYIFLLLGIWTEISHRETLRPVTYTAREPTGIVWQRHWTYSPLSHLPAAFPFPKSIISSSSSSHLFSLSRDTLILPSPNLILSLSLSPVLFEIFLSLSRIQLPLVGFWNKVLWVWKYGGKRLSKLTYTATFLYIKSFSLW